MAITSVSGIASGLLPPISAFKTSNGTSNSGPLQWVSNWYETGYPVPATVYAGGLTGQALTSSAAAYPYPNPASGNAYLARVARLGTGSGNPSNLMLVDRLWENSGLDRTSIIAQPFSSAAWPARDINQSTNGEGVYIALECTVGILGTATTPVVTMEYTNSAGATGKIGSTFFGTRAIPPRGQWFVLGLADGDTGVRSVQSITFSASWGSSGSLGLVAFRPIALISNLSGPDRDGIEDAISMALPRLYNNTVLQSVIWAFTQSELSCTEIQITQG